MILRASRRTVSGKWLYEKIWLFVIAGGLGIAGMTAHIDWLVTVAIVILAIAIIAKLIADRQVRDAESETTDASEE